MKTLTAKLREVPSAAVQIEDVFASGDWLRGSAVIEHSKREMLHKIRNAIHEQAATLSLDDIDFKITS